MDRHQVAKLDEQLLGAWNDHDADAFIAGCADDIIWTDSSSPEPFRGKDAARQYIEGWFRSMPDMSTTRVRTVVGDDNTVAVDLIFQGTNTGPLAMGDQEIPATGKTVVGRGAYFSRFNEDGELAEISTHPDLAGMMGQLGLAG